MTPIESGRPQLMRVVEDGIISGYVPPTRQMCRHCGHYTVCVGINRVDMPMDIDPMKTIMRRNDQELLDFIGIGCGCYAKFHRQVAHIMDKLKARQKESE